MKSNVESMQDEMSRLQSKMKEMSEFSSKITERLANKRTQIQRLNGIQSLIKKV